ncbi:MAG: hypothetical protein BWX88_04121 [Planctomycetes bacterium ADurb.Bin126]|nr:MAG: hypothetical protein BWX88_04121 [Planctomycetes bacterium ADurb.Bin126]
MPRFVPGVHCGVCFWPALRALETCPFAGRPGVHPVFRSRRREPYSEYWGIFIVSPSFTADRCA